METEETIKDQNVSFSTGRAGFAGETPSFSQPVPLLLEREGASFQRRLSEAVNDCVAMTAVGGTVASSGNMMLEWHFWKGTVIF